ncbi:lycopene cyclase family protein [Corynebacterium pygosceleis]|uniref:Lycopene cyclase family protein n=1 Tax=Corynebacterium pygosceleis TaxID=2800406 RepID=A0A9Q4GK33_9CORY|nr:lycopene cyclase family protein [Corynebacterium pygosceleis]MCK7637014.1 lycopene cyclase family protein [Corynebacterium pygosceleis]MCK7674488.1 lycopene cyclase family protein [Corynebacterium pygosceleis]MCL0120214.1 lycopene cyclase family protein [Corynebacterium pygosceleis]MCX7467767.1 lycopene cyclase family protein [Corynebacterium pygosceleis]
MSSSAENSPRPDVTRFDMIVVGLGPSGAALAHRASLRGWDVLGVDPQPVWRNTYGLFTDELPDWLPDPPVESLSTPSVIGESEHHPDREYAILDNDALRRRFLTFPTIIGAAAEVGRRRVRVNNRTHVADIVVDARGATETEGPVQQAYGVVLHDEAAPVWMDLRPLEHGTTPTFHYQIPVRGGMLHEETSLVHQGPLPWEVLRNALRQRIGDHPDAEVIASEKVLFPMNAPADIDPTGPVPFGARAGFINPISGFSVATSLELTDPTLDTLSSIIRGGTQHRLPWMTPRYRADRRLLSIGQQVLLELDPDELPLFLEKVFTLSRTEQKRFLHLGDPVGTMRGMLRIFLACDRHLQRKIIRAVVSRSQRS